MQDLESFGQFIKGEREKKGLSLEEISRSTKISRSILEALESDRIDDLPAPAFVKGFLRAYSLYLGLDPKDVISRYIGYTSLYKNTRPDRIIAEKTPPPGKIGFVQNKILIRSRRLETKWIAAALLISLIIFSLWFVCSLFFKSSPTTRQGSVVQQEAQKETNKYVIPGKAKKEDIPVAKKDEGFEAREALIKGEEQGVEQGMDASSADQASIASQAQEKQGTEETQISQQAPVSPPDTVKGPTKALIITAIDITWIDIGIDDQPHIDLILKPGEEIRLEAKSQFFLWIGNAGGVEVNFEGTPLGTLGKKGEVKRVRLPQ